MAPRKPTETLVVSREIHDRNLFLKNEVLSAADVMLGIDTGGTFETFTCTEIQALADVFAAAGRQDTADFIINQHGLGDYDPEDDHHDIYLKEGNPNA